MTKSSGSPGSDRKEFMNTVGAVTRGGPNNIWIDQKLDTVNYFSGEFPLSWKSYADAKDFQFSLYSSDNISTAMYTSIVGKLKIPINNFAPEIGCAGSHFWSKAINRNFQLADNSCVHGCADIIIAIQGELKIFCISIRFPGKRKFSAEIINGI